MGKDQLENTSTHECCKMGEGGSRKAVLSPDQRNTVLEMIEWKDFSNEYKIINNE